MPCTLWLRVLLPESHRGAHDGEATRPPDVVRVAGVERRAVEEVDDGLVALDVFADDTIRSKREEDG